MTKFPPSLSRIRTETDRRVGHIERLTELETRRNERVAATKDAMKRLPLKPDAESEIPKMASLFEQTHYDITRRLEDKPATTRTMEEELEVLAKGLGKVADHVERMQPDTLRIWAAFSDVAANSTALLLILRTAEEWANSSVNTLKQAKRIGGPGRTEDQKAKQLRETAAFIYRHLTMLKDNIAYDPYAGKEFETEFVAFLNRIYKAYGVQASSKSRARKRRPMAKKR